MLEKIDGDHDNDDFDKIFQSDESLSINDYYLLLDRIDEANQVQQQQQPHLEQQQLHNSTHKCKLIITKTCTSNIKCSDKKFVDRISGTKVDKDDVNAVLERSYYLSHTFYYMNAYKDDANGYCQLYKIVGYDQAITVDDKEQYYHNGIKIISFTSYKKKRASNIVKFTNEVKEYIQELQSQPQLQQQQYQQQLHSSDRRFKPITKTCSSNIKCSDKRFVDRISGIKVDKDDVNAVLEHSYYLSHSFYYMNAYKDDANGYCQLYKKVDYDQAITVDDKGQYYHNGIKIISFNSYRKKRASNIVGFTNEVKEYIQELQSQSQLQQHHVQQPSHQNYSQSNASTAAPARLFNATNANNKRPRESEIANHNKIAKYV